MTRTTVTRMTVTWRQRAAYGATVLVAAAPVRRMAAASHPAAFGEQGRVVAAVFGRTSDLFPLATLLGLAEPAPAKGTDSVFSTRTCAATWPNSPPPARTAGYASRSPTPTASPSATAAGGPEAS